MPLFPLPNPVRAILDPELAEKMTADVFKRGQDARGRGGEELPPASRRPLESKRCLQR